MQITVKTIKLTLKAFHQLRHITAEEFQVAEVLGYVNHRSLYFLCRVRGELRIISHDMWKIHDRRGWVKEGCPEWGVSWVGCGSGDGLLFVSREACQEFIASKRSTDLSEYDQIFI